MIVETFNKVGLKAYIYSFSFSLAVIFLINYCKHHRDWNINNIFEIFILWIIFAFFTFFVTFLQTKKSSFEPIKMGVISLAIKNFIMLEKISKGTLL